MRSAKTARAASAVASAAAAAAAAAALTPCPLSAKKEGEEEVAAPSPLPPPLPLLCVESVRESACGAVPDDAAEEAEEEKDSAGSRAGAGATAVRALASTTRGAPAVAEKVAGSAPGLPPPSVPPPEVLLPLLLPPPPPPARAPSSAKSQPCQPGWRSTTSMLRGSVRSRKWRVDSAGQAADGAAAPASTSPNRSPSAWAETQATKGVRNAQNAGEEERGRANNKR
jgi:hypothetical protein